MAGTKAGAKKAAATNMRKYGDDFYSRIGRRGGQNGNTGGFASDSERAKMAGTIGGVMSRKNANVKKMTVTYKVLSPIPETITIAHVGDVDNYEAKTYGNGREFYHDELGSIHVVTVRSTQLSWRIIQSLADEAYIQIISTDIEDEHRDQLWRNDKQECKQECKTSQS